MSESTRSCEQQARLNAMAQVCLGPCLLCGGKPARMAGLFVPDDPEAWGAPVGKSREIYFGLCSLCHDASGRAQAVEQKIVAQLAQGRNN